MDNIFFECSELTKKSPQGWATSGLRMISLRRVKRLERIHRYLNSMLKILIDIFLFAQDILNDPETMAFTGELSKLCWGIVTSDQVS